MGTPAPSPDDLERAAWIERQLAKAPELTDERAARIARILIGARPDQDQPRRRRRKPV